MLLVDRGLMNCWEYYIERIDSLDDLLELFGQFLDSADYIYEGNGKESLVESRGRVGEIDGYKIIVYSREHAPPHFHVVKGVEKLASFDIKSCEMINGSLPSKVEKKVHYFYRHSKDKLVLFWNNTRPDDCSVGRIELS